MNPDVRSENEEPIDSFLRWVGGKRLLVRRLLTFLPPSIRERTYREPFLGAASLFFALRPRKAVLSDLNEHLIECYRHVRDRPDRVAQYLRKHALENTKPYYYSIRDAYNRLPTSAAQAARFIYLNKTCFNGVFRVNMRGQFNVPYGDKQNPIFPDTDWLRRASDALRRAKLRAESFETALAAAEPGDFIYLDPPYPPLNGTSYFTHYTADRFNESNQRALAGQARDLSDKGCLLMISNADTEMVRDLYAGFQMCSLSVTRFVTCKRKRHRVDELVITNYTPCAAARQFTLQLL